MPIRSGDGGKTWEVSRIEVKEDDDFIYQSSRQIPEEGMSLLLVL